MARSAGQIEGREVRRYQEEEERDLYRRVVQGLAGRIQRIHALLQRPELHVGPRLRLHYQPLRGRHEEERV